MKNDATYTYQVLGGKHEWNLALIMNLCDHVIRFPSLLW